MDFKKRVKCINTGEIFASSKDAAEKYNIKEYKNINKCCNHKRKSAGIYNNEKLIWEYVEVEKEIKKCQEGVSEGVSEGVKLKASDFKLSWKQKDIKFIKKYYNEQYMSLDEMEKLSKRLKVFMDAEEKRQAKVQKNKD